MAYIAYNKKFKFDSVADIYMAQKVQFCSL